MVELSEEIYDRIISRCKRIGESVERYHQRHKLTDCLTKKLYDYGKEKIQQSDG